MFPSGIFFIMRNYIPERKCILAPRLLTIPFLSLNFMILVQLHLQLQMLTAGCLTQAQTSKQDEAIDLTESLFSPLLSEEEGLPPTGSGTDGNPNPRKVLEPDTTWSTPFALDCATLIDAQNMTPSLAQMCL